MHADEPVSRPAQRAGELAAGVMTMVLVAAVIAAIGFGVLWLAVTAVQGFIDAIFDPT